MLNKRVIAISLFSKLLLLWQANRDNNILAVIFYFVNCRQIKSLDKYNQI